MFGAVHRLSQPRSCWQQSVAACCHAGSGPICWHAFCGVHLDTVCMPETSNQLQSSRVCTRSLDSGSRACSQVHGLCAFLFVDSSSRLACDALCDSSNFFTLQNCCSQLVQTIDRLLDIITYSCDSVINRWAVDMQRLHHQLLGQQPQHSFKASHRHNGATRNELLSDQVPNMVKPQTYSVNHPKRL